MSTCKCDDARPCEAHSVEIHNAARGLLKALKDMAEEFSAQYDQVNEPGSKTDKERIRLIKQAKRAISKAEGGE